MQTTKLNFLKIFVLIGILLCLMSYNYAQSGANLNTFVKHLVAGGGGGGDDGDDDGDDNGDNDGDDDGDDNGDDDGDWGWNDSIPNWTEPTVDELIEQLIAAGYGECLTDAPEFASVDEVYNYVYENCMDDWDGDNGWGCGDSIPYYEPTVDELIEQLIAAGYGECLTDAPDFDSIDEVFEYINENCNDWSWGDSTWVGNDTIPNWTEPTVEEVLQQLIDAGYGDCLADAPTFASVDELYNYFYEHCYDYYEPTVEEVLQQLIDAGYGDCLADAPDFATIDEVYNYFYENCYDYYEPTVEEVLQQLIDAGYGDCLADAPTFASVDELYNYFYENCYDYYEPTVEEVLQQLIDAGYGDCLADAPTFASVDEVFEYINENCNDWNWGGEDTVVVYEPTVDELIEQLIAAGYGECLTNAPDFASIDEVFAYLDANCDAFNNDIIIPDCLSDLFANNASPTFQDYIQYVAANCDSTYLYGIPDCFFMAPDFSTDEAFFAWVSDNCEGFSVDNIGGMAVDSNGNLGALATYYTAVARGEQLASGTTTAAIANQVIVYPNPVLNQATIQSKNTAIQTVSIYDAVGKLISSQSGLNTYQYQIATNGWTSGIYLVRIEAIDGTVSNQRINVVK